jgi:hypothetical protein
MLTTEVAIPLDAIPPGEVLAETDTRLVFLPGVSVGDARRQHFRLVESSDREAFEADTRADGRVTDLATVDRPVSDSTYRIEWSEPPPCPAVYREDLLIERMGGTPDGWVFRLRAPDGEAIRELREDCRDRSTGFTVRYLDQSPGDVDEYGLTRKQREVLLVAAEAGYFSLPRESTLDDLAAELDISDQAVLERLRRAQWNVLRHTVLADAAESTWLD